MDFVVFVEVISGMAFLNPRCFVDQVLACDPEDAIIAEPSSTKAGVAITVELGALSSSLDVYHPPKVTCY